MQPLVSIALCTYNGEKFLREQLDTLVYQTYPNLEIIAVDDCSKDSTLTILKEYEKQFPFLKVYQNEINLGFVKNFEKAISLCVGDFVALSDQDDIWSLSKISILENKIGGNILIYHDSELIDSTGEPIGRKISDKFNMFSGSDARKLLFFNCLSGHAMLFKKALLPQIIPFHTLLLHDWWIAYIAANVGNIEYVPDCLIKFRQHINSQTDFNNFKKQQKKKYILSNWLQACKLLTLNRYPDFVVKLANLYRQHDDSWFMPELVKFIFQNRLVLLALQKKSSTSKLNYIYKMIWGNKWRQQIYKR
ncbi:MAG: glycosyltransferase family 2 protein [Sphingobacteriaceae bacterium]|nr:MAG: glycosyltransferase family 2 protein [Sphingobacteriaceae bacterium]